MTSVSTQVASEVKRPGPHPAIAHVLQYFKYGHLPEKLQARSKPFCDLAWQIAEWAPDSPEMTVALRKLLECKDAAVRACL